VVVGGFEPGIPGTRGPRLSGSFGSGVRSVGSVVGAGPPLGVGYRLRSSSRRRRMISSADGNPNGPVLRDEPDVGIEVSSPPGNVGGVVPFGDGCLITDIVGRLDEAPACSRASASVVARVS
jgi:hypothetical protein